MIFDPAYYPHPFSIKLVDMTRQIAHPDSHFSYEYPLGRIWFQNFAQKFRTFRKMESAQDR